MGRDSGDPGESVEERAARVAAASDHHGVTEELLGGTGRFSTTFYLYDEPAVAYLEAGEHVHFGFYDEMKGIGVGEPEETYVPDNNGITIVLVTDKRVLALVGRSEGDHAVSMHYDTVTGARFEAGTFHDRLVVETASETYHCWINPVFGDEELGLAVTCIRERMADPRDLIADRSSGSDGGAGQSSGVASDGGARSDDAGRGTDGPASVDGTDPPDDGGDDGPSEDPLDRIEKLHELKEAGAITTAEYERKKARLLEDV